MDGSTGMAEGRPAASPQRTRGAATVSAELRDGHPRLGRLRQEGSLKVLLPTQAPGAALEAVLLNTSGGLTGGDRLRVAAQAGPGARLVVSTQAAERVYRSSGGMAEVEAALTVGLGGRLDWLPQETILYDGAALDRRLTLDVAPGARALLVEPVILGRRAMGERVRSATFRDRWDIRQDGRLVFADRLRIEGETWGKLESPGTLDGAGAWASLLLLSPEAPSLLGRLRSLLPTTAGASVVREGVLFARILAEDGFRLRQALVPAAELLAGGPLPKVWRL
ncbi:Urease accessory protein UreD [Rubellimicrobium mesophilum DSM 19309]|uniref:Urease accessory protein UreD n=1 Tax=Rubellimicrobium mesophilum DSM 19309 TaxID=442562 RepID=A0A017HGK7_9RHOB|nr:urease accessory protein UreD [Rubellimicrobium mesophilum]EYD72934.1 Urease accessory protein UreD [Rubellimicrobium mesophilum DSM 19309]